MNTVATHHSRALLDEFSRCRDTLPGRQLAWLNRLREDALASFMASGLPTPRDEEWKYTNVAAIAEKHFTLADADADEGSALHQQQLVSRIAALALPGAHLLVFLDGRLLPACTDLGRLPVGVSIASMAAMLDQEPAWLQSRLTPATPYSSGFAALNLACMNDGAYIHLAANTVLAEPVHLLFLTRSTNLATHSRNLIVADAGSRACIVAHHASLDAANYCSNVSTQLVLGQDAQIEHCQWQDESNTAFHIAAIDAELAAGSRFVSSLFALGGALARTDIQVSLNGAGADCSLDGLYLADGRQHLDQHTRIDHRQPRGSSRELYKGVLAGGGRAVFNGKVIVHPDAQRSDAALSNRNLLLSAQAEIDTKPQLEIWADDVKCSHSATVGRLDDEHIFYLRSRGIDEAAARALLIHAFAAEIVDRVGPLPLRARLDALLRARLAPPLESPS